MSNLVPVTNSGGVSRVTDRQTSRHVARVEAGTTRNLAVIEAETDLQVARVHALGYIGQQGMQSIAMVSQLEGQLAELVPLATSRLQAIADMTALATAEVVANTVRKVSR